MTTLYSKLIGKFLGKYSDIHDFSIFMFRSKYFGSERPIISSSITALKLAYYSTFLKVLGCLILPPWTSRDSQELHPTGLVWAEAEEPPVRTRRTVRQRAGTGSGVLQDLQVRECSQGNQAEFLNKTI